MHAADEMRTTNGVQTRDQSAHEGRAEIIGNTVLAVLEPTAAKETTKVQFGTTVLEPTVAEGEVAKVQKSQAAARHSETAMSAGGVDATALGEQAAVKAPEHGDSSECW